MVMIRNIIILFLTLIPLLYADLVQLTSANHDDVLQRTRLVFTIFTVEWCPYSTAFKPIFNGASNEYAKKHIGTKTIWAVIDCVREAQICQNHHVSKYPTTGVYFYGNKISEYRSTRTAEAVIKFIEKFEDVKSLIDMTEIPSIDDWKKYSDPTKATLILWYPQTSAPFELMLRGCAILHDRLHILVPKSNDDLKTQQHVLRVSNDYENYDEYNGPLEFKNVAEWLRLKVAKIVRELTFENAEEIVEEERPLLLLFRNKNDTSLEKKFNEAVRRELSPGELPQFNILITDGNVMKFPMRRVGKTAEELPFLVIDQLVHMYLAPYKDDEIFAPGNIAQFIRDFFDETLHRRFHGLNGDEKKDDGNNDKGKENFKEVKKVESAFKQLEPAKNRYSFAKQEL